MSINQKDLQNRDNHGTLITQTFRLPSKTWFHPTMLGSANKVLVKRGTTSRNISKFKNRYGHGIGGKNIDGWISRTKNSCEHQNETIFASDRDTSNTLHHNHILITHNAIAKTKCIKKSERSFCSVNSTNITLKVGTR